jgi:2-C-methyl-D-erythritol 4-phosphate cytidylyltransferase
MEVEHPVATAIVLAAGIGRRLGADDPKAFVSIGGRPVLSVAAAAAAASSAVSSIVVAVPAGMEQRALDCLEDLNVPLEVVGGGATRQASVRAALAAVADDVDVIVVHDAARPFAPPDLFTEVVKAVLAGADGAVPAIAPADTVKRVHDGVVVSTLDRDELALAQTPQAFGAERLRAAHERAAVAGLEVTDDAALLELAGGTVRVVRGDARNFKITTLMDLARADARMGERRG